MPVTVSLPNYTTAHINEKGEVFYLTPAGGPTAQHYDSRLSEYQRADLEIRISMGYNADGYLIHPDTQKVISHSIAKKKEELTSASHKISLWIQACHFIVVKSSLGRYWFLHYDPGQARSQSNDIDGLSYPRPNYSDLRPVLPYNVEGIALQENETIQVVVVEPDKNYDISDPENLKNGEFDAQAFKDFVGEDKIKKIEVIRHKDHLKSQKEEMVDLSFFTQEDKLEISLKSTSAPFYSTKNLFQGLTAKIETPLILEFEEKPDLLHQLRNAINQAQIKYALHYEDNSKNARGINGWFSMFRHGPKGQIQAKIFEHNTQNMNLSQILEALNQKFNSQKTAYHRHSFSSYLLDEISNLLGTEPKDKYTVKNWNLLALKIQNSSNPNTIPAIN